MISSKYKHLFFDLDHTLLDTDAISREALQEIYDELKLYDMGIMEFDRFYLHYSRINAQYWARYHKQYVTKEKLRIGRFTDTLRYFGVDRAGLADQISTSFLDKSKTKPYLLPNAIDTLQYLRDHYAMHIITNGMSDVQYVKIEESGLGEFITHIIISDEVGVQKPQRGIFNHAMQLAQTTAVESLMIGDNLATDIAGARAVGMDQVYFNPSKLYHGERPTYEIADLAALRELL